VDVTAVRDDLTSVVQQTLDRSCRNSA
jgi:hypothetical protein